jgi:hypothetical protein
LVAGAIAKPEATNPILKYDKYWNTYFNFETQGYYVRQAYRSNIEYQLTRAFSLLEIYYNIFDPRTANTQDTHYENYVKAMEALERMPAGQSPEDVDRSADRNGNNKRFRIYCPTFDCDITDLQVEDKVTGCKVLDEQIQEFIRRMNGRTVREELELAGLWGNGLVGDWYYNILGEVYHNPGSYLLWDGQIHTGVVDKNYSWDNYYTRANYGRSGHGIGLNCRQQDNDFYADFIDANGILHKDVLTFRHNADYITSVFDMPPEMGYTYNVNYIFFVMEPHVG